MHDLRAALRSLLRRPGYPLVAVAILALGLAAAVAVFTYVNGFYQPFPGVDAGRLVRVLGGQTGSLDYRGDAQLRHLWDDSEPVHAHIDAFGVAQIDPPVFEERGADIAQVNTENNARDVALLAGVETQPGPAQEPRAPARHLAGIQAEIVQRQVGLVPEAPQADQQGRDAGENEVVPHPLDVVGVADVRRGARHRVGRPDETVEHRLKGAQELVHQPSLSICARLTRSAAP